MYLEKEKQQSELDVGLVVVGIRRVYLGVARPESGLGQCLGAVVVQFVSLAPSAMVAIRAGVAGVGIVCVGNHWGTVGKRSFVNMSSFYTRLINHLTYNLRYYNLIKNFIVSFVLNIIKKKLLIPPSRTIIVIIFFFHIRSIILN